MANIMIVDDSPIIRRSLRGILESLGHRIVVEAENGKEAVQIYDEDRIDLVTMDIQLPGIDGIEAVRLIRERNPNAAIVMISSLEHRGKVYEAIKLGARHYIVKPYTEDKVGEVIQAVLGIPVPQQEDKTEQVAKGKEASTDRAQAGRDLPLLEVPTLSTLPFELVIKDGRAVLVVQRHITPVNIRAFAGALQGLLYYRKAKYVVDLWEPIFYEEGMKLLFEFVSAVRNRGGTVGIVSGAHGYYTQVKAKLQNGVYRSYDEIEW